MVARDSTVQLAVVALLVASSVVTVQFGVPGLVDGLVLSVGSLVVVAGSHVYLAVRGDGAYVPVAARWRFVGLAALFTIFLVVAPRTVGIDVAGVPVSTALWTSFGAIFAGYVLYEIRDGYRTTRLS